MHLSVPAILKRLDFTWGHDCSTRRKKIRDLSWKGFKVHPGAGFLWSYSWAKFHVRFGGRDVGRNCFATLVIDTWSADWFLPFAHSQSINPLAVVISHLWSFCNKIQPLPAPICKWQWTLVSYFSLPRFFFTCGIIDEGVGDAEVCVLKSLPDGCQVSRVLPRSAMCYASMFPTVYLDLPSRLGIRSNFATSLIWCRLLSNQFGVIF